MGELMTEKTYLTNYSINEALEMYKNGKVSDTKTKVAWGTV